MDKRKLIKICIVLFVLSAGVRFIVWQNNKVTIAAVQYIVTEGYEHDAELLRNGSYSEFLSGPDPPSDANILLHPPGYPIFLAVVESVVGNLGTVQAVQILVNSLIPVLFCLIGTALFGRRTGPIAGSLAALSPQLAYHSGIILPDELSVVPVLLAVYAFALGYQRPLLRWALLCGISVGLSCWLRANALLLPVFFSAAALLLVPAAIRTRFSISILASFILTISPITVRNYCVFDNLIPLSLGTGTTFVEGLADLNTDRKGDLPQTDEDVMASDAARFGRPDYYSTLYNPDGVMRDRARIEFGLGVVRSDPLWFLGGVFKRGINTVRLERVPVIVTERNESETIPYLLHVLNVPLKLVQRLFITAVFLPLTVLGVILLLFKDADRGKLLLLGVVPLYYMTVQPLLHTEYRYVLPAYISMIFAAVAVSYLVGKIMTRSNLNGVSSTE